jgi:hypothetical protein
VQLGFLNRIPQVGAYLSVIAESHAMIVQSRCDHHSEDVLSPFRDQLPTYEVLAQSVAMHHEHGRVSNKTIAQTAGDVKRNVCSDAPALPAICNIVIELIYYALQLERVSRRNRTHE